MEIDFDFEINVDNSDIGIHGRNESWFSFLRDGDENISIKQRNTSGTSCKKDDDVSDTFTYKDINLFGTTPILESFTALSCALTPTVNNYNVSSPICADVNVPTSIFSYQSNSLPCLDIPSYSGVNTNSPSKSSRKRPLVNYSESEHDSAFSSHSPSTASSSSFNQDLDAAITDSALSEKSSASSPPTVSSSSSKKRSQSSSHSSSGSSKRQHVSSSTSSSSTSSSSSHHHIETSARTSGIVTSNNPRLNRSERRLSPAVTKIKECLPQIENTIQQSPCDKLPERPPVEPACRTRTELTPLPGSAPAADLLPDAVPTTGDTLLETASSPTKPTDEPALPEDDVDVKPSIVIKQETIYEETVTSVENTTPPVNLINVSVDELSIDVLKLKHPLLFSQMEDEEDEPAKKFVKYDPFTTETDVVFDDDNLEPKRKIVKFKYSPFEPTTSENGTNSNIFIMELEETIDTKPLPCGVYEIEATKPYCRIKPDPGIYETSDDTKKETSPTSFLLDEDGNLNWKLSKIGAFDFEIEPQEAPPTPQTPVCMKRIHTEEEITFVNMFSGLYDIETVSPDAAQMRSLQIPSLSGMQFRQLVTKPRPRSKVGNSITPSLLQDYQMKSTLKSCLNNLHTARTRNRTSSNLRP